MKRILLVDDNEAFRQPLSESLKQAGYYVQTADEGSGALKLFCQQPFDLVVTDLIMPGREGLETIIELRRLKPNLHIIAISGGGRLGPEDYLPMAQRLGATETLAKPFTTREILEIVAKLLSDCPRSSTLPAEGEEDRRAWRTFEESAHAGLRRAGPWTMPSRAT